jgi:hypothetical protein
MIDYLQRTPFIRILLPFLSGVITESFVWLRLDRLLFIFILVLFLSLMVIVRRSGYYRDTLAGILFTLFFFLSGIFVTSEKNKPKKFTDGSFYQATILHST